MKSKNMHYDPDNSEVIPFNKYGKHNEISPPNSGDTSSSKLCFNLIIIAYICAASSLIVFIALLTLRLEKVLENLDAFEVLLPFLLFLIFANLLFNKLIGHPYNNSTALGKFFLYFTHNSIFIFLFLFALLLIFKIEDFISLKYVFVFIPIDLIFAIMFLFICFIFPGLLDKNIAMYQEAFLLIAYYFITLITVIFTTIKLDGAIKWEYYKFFLGELTLIGLHFFLVVKNIFSNKENLENEIVKLVFLILLFFSLLLPVLKIDEELDLSWKFALIPIDLIIIYIIFQGFKSLVKLFRNPEEM